jgi:hypothetical protein
MEPNQEGAIFIPAANIQQAMSNPNFPKHYANGFVIGRAENDIFILPVNNSIPSFVLNLSFSSAKKLYEALKVNIEEIESRIGEIKSMPPPTKSQK